MFQAVARTLGFSKAARELGKTQSSVSQAVLLLERELGQKLFVRDGRTARLTDAGKTLLVHAQRIFEEMERARASLTALADLSSGELVIGTSDTFACYLLPPVLASFRDRYPGIELRIDARPSPLIAERVSERLLHVGIVSLPLPPELEVSGRPVSERLAIEACAPLEDVAICLPSHPLARRRSARVHDLAPLPLLLLDRHTSARNYVEAAFAAAGAAPRVAMEMNSVEVLKRLVELDFGVSVVPRMSLEVELKTGRLAALRLRDFGPARQIGVLTPRVGGISAAALAFVAMTREALRQR